MGTRYSAVFHGPAGIDTILIGAALQAAVDRVDNQMSTWKPCSDLSLVNAAPCDVWIDIPPELQHVLAAGLAIATASGGAFDIGVGDLVDAWGFGAAGATPDLIVANSLAGAARRETAGALELDAVAGRVRKRSATKLDLSGIAKGFGVDALAGALDVVGTGSYLVSIDGELRARGLKPDGSPWVVAVERPERGTRDAGGVLELTDRAIATSGDYRHWVDVGGNSVSHTMDPRTGRPVANALTSVTVLAVDCMSADAWATALLVLGAVEGPGLARHLNLDALFIARGANGLDEIPIGCFAAQARRKA